jgi:phospholipid transport system substrate-binding protein
MTRSRVLVVGLVVGAALLAAGAASAGPPTEQLRGAIDRVLKTVEDPTLKAENKTTERRQAVRKIANEIFDWGETAKRSLGRHWQARTEAEREEFVRLFGDLLERAYISKIELYGGEKITYTGESIDDSFAVVKTKIVTPKQGTEVPVDYRLLLRGERWLVYDVVIEGISLVSNYRTQFNKIIQSSSYQELVKKMKTKQEEFLQDDKAKRTSAL